MKVILVMLFIVSEVVQGSDLSRSVDEWEQRNNLNRTTRALENISDELKYNGENPASLFLPGVDPDDVLKRMKEDNAKSTEELRLIREAAQGRPPGDAITQYNFAVMYEDGKHGKGKESIAFYWYSLSAKQGYADAQAALGRVYETGTGCTKDNSQAVYWYRKAAEQGVVSAQNRLEVLAEYDTKNSAVQVDIPKFNDYPATTIYNRKNHPLVLDEFSKTFKTRLSNAIKYDKPVFAGHYLVTYWGCGTSCNFGVIIDAITGIAYPFPVTTISSVYPLKSEFENEAGREIIYRLDSNLIIFAGDLDGSDDTIQFYEFKNGEFILLKTLLYGKKAQ